MTSSGVNDVEKGPEQSREDRNSDHISQSTESFPPALEEKDFDKPTPSYPPSEPDPVVVSRSSRRGLCGEFTLIPEVENPKAYPRKTKWFITFIVAAAGATAPMGSSIFFRE